MTLRTVRQWALTYRYGALGFIVLSICLIIHSRQKAPSIVCKPYLGRRSQRAQSGSNAAGVWQSLHDDFVQCRPDAFFSLSTLPADSNKNPTGSAEVKTAHVFTWHKDPNFFLVANTPEDYITTLAQPEAPFFEYGISRWLVATLDMVRTSRGRSGAVAEALIGDHPVWMLDIGGNIGIHSLYAAASGYPVVAVEGFPPTSAHLSCSKLVNRFEHLYVVPFAISQVPTTLCFSFGVTNVGASSTSKNVDCPDNRRAAAYPLDELLNDVEATVPINKLGPPAIMKIDIEGYEWEAIASLQKHFSDPLWRPMYIFAELYPDFLASKGASFVQLAQTLINYGYNLLSADQSVEFTDEMLRKSVDDKVERFECHNFIFVLKGSPSPPVSSKVCTEYN